VYCVVTDDVNDKRRNDGLHSIYEDDCGAWNGSKGTTNRYPYIMTAHGESFSA